MTTHVGVGVSHHRNPRVAGQEAVAQALATMTSPQVDFVFLFASIGYPQHILLEAVNTATNHAPLCGCSGEGIIVQNEHNETNFSVAVMLLSSDDLRFHNGVATGLQADSTAVGQAIGQAIQPVVQPDTVALFLFPDGITCNFDHLVAGIEPSIQTTHFLPLVGGFASDNWEARQTYQYCNDQVVSDSTAWAVLSGPARLISVVNHGCIPIGTERIITRSEGNVIYEIDGKPALAVFREYLTEDELNDWARTVANLCLGFKTPSYLQGYDDYIIRFLPAKDDAAQSVTISTDVAPGISMWFTRRDYEKIAHGLDIMADQVTRLLDGQRPLLVFQFDCAGRGKVIFRDTQKHQLLHTLQTRIGTDVPWLGFCTYGEIGPVGNHNAFHNYTAVLTVLVTH